MKTRPASRLRGFTLIELLVSIAVLSLLTIAMFSILNSASGTWSRSERQSDAFRESRAALDLMASDLQAIIRSKNFDQWFHSPGGLPNGVTITNYQAGSNASTMGFFTMASKSAQDPTLAKGQMCAVIYCVSYLPDPATGPNVTAKSSYKLYRKFLHSEDAAKLLTNSGGTGTITVNTTLTPEDILARNVAGLSLRPYWYGTGGKLDPTPPANAPRNPPVAIDIEFSAFNATAAAGLPNQGAWEGRDPKFQNYYRQNQQKFFTRVFLSKR